VQSDSDVSVTGSAAINAGTVQAAGTATGNISPTPQTGSPVIADPFASMSINPPLLNICNPVPVLTAGLNILIALPTPYCGNITVRSGQTLQLSPGTYYFRNGQLQMQQDSVLTGSNVTLIFDQTAQFQFQDSSVIDLTGAHSGQYAGFVIVTTRQNTSTFTISSGGAVFLRGLTIDGSTGGNNGITVIDAPSLTIASARARHPHRAGLSIPTPRRGGCTKAAR